MGLGHPEDVVDGSGSQDLPHGLRDDIHWLDSLHLHGAQEANDKELVEDRVYAAQKTEKTKHTSCMAVVPLELCKTWFFGGLNVLF